MSHLIQISDNSKKEFEPKQLEELRALSGLPIKSTQQEGNPNLLIFTHSLSDCPDKIQDSPIFTIEGDHILSSGNIMGFVGYKNTRLRIYSRFAKEDEQDFFLHYMLQRVFAINLFDLQYNSAQTDIFDFLIYLFPSYLKRAYRQGLYKEYKTHHYNDAHLRGRIDVAQHIRTNIPFNGNIAYQTREYAYNNDLTQLIRHTIEYIRQHPYAGGILLNDTGIKDAVKAIEHATPTYNRQERSKVINHNLRPIHHPYYNEYRNLQQLCMQILRHEELKYGTTDDEIYGILFDGAWLWEEYLAIVLKNVLTHYTSDGPKRFRLFNKSYRRIVPDFLNEQAHIVADAKYIPLDISYIAEGSERETAIYYKTLVYMYRFKCSLGYLFYPLTDSSSHKQIETLTLFNDSTQVLHKVGLSIPQNVSSWVDFQNQMSKNEDAFIEQIKHQF